MTAKRTAFSATAAWRILFLVSSEVVVPAVPAVEVGAVGAVGGAVGAVGAVAVSEGPPVVDCVGDPCVSDGDSDIFFRPGCRWVTTPLFEFITGYSFPY